MTAPLRRADAARRPLNFPAAPGHDRFQELWRAAVDVRQEWLALGLSTERADREATAHHLAGIYARLGRAAPAVLWVDSPARALPLLGGLPTLGDLYTVARCPRASTPPVASDLAMVSARLRAGLSAGVAHGDPELVPARRNKRGDPWPERPAPEALREGVPLGVVLHQGIRASLHRSLARGVAHPVRDVLAAAGRLPVCWYGQQDASWIAYYDMLRRLGLARYGPEESAHLAHWAGLSRSCGWWWPGDDVCVVVERPELLATRPVAGALDDDVRVVPDGVRYRDGWSPAVT